MGLIDLAGFRAFVTEFEKTSGLTLRLATRKAKNNQRYFMKDAEFLMDRNNIVNVSFLSSLVLQDWVHLSKLTLSDLRPGTLDDPPTLVAGKTQVAQSYVEGFVNGIRAMGLPSDSIEILTWTESPNFPLILVSRQLSCLLAPIVDNTAAEEPPHGPEVIIKETVREIVKVPCHYCGALNESTTSRCITCGAPAR